jgi:hypothetical protein
MYASICALSCGLVEFRFRITVSERISSPAPRSNTLTLDPASVEPASAPPKSAAPPVIRTPSGLVQLLVLVIASWLIVCALCSSVRVGCM